MYGQTPTGSGSLGTGRGAVEQGYDSASLNKAKPELHTRVEHLQQVVNELEKSVTALGARLGPVLRQHPAEPAQPPGPPRAVPSTPMGVELDTLFSRLFDVNARAQILLEDLEV